MVQPIKVIILTLFFLGIMIAAYNVGVSDGGYAYPQVGGQEYCEDTEKYEAVRKTFRCFYECMEDFDPRDGNICLHYCRAQPEE